MLTFTETGNPHYPYAIHKNGTEAYALFPVQFDGPEARTHWYRLETLNGRATRVKRSQFFSYNPTDDVFFGADSSLRYQPGAKIVRHN